MDYIFHVTQAQKGNRTSYEYLINNFRGMSISHAYSILHDFQLAEDAAQEAFILLFNNIQNLKEPSAFPSWLKKLVFTCCNRISRKQKPETSIEDIGESFDSSNDPSAVFEDNEKSELVKKALSQLTEGQQEVFLLYYTFDKSYSEIAVDLNITEAAVTSRLHQGKKKLKDIMLSTMMEYLGGYKMDKNEFTRKIINEISKPAQPGTFQGSEYVACFASLYKAIEKSNEYDQQQSYYKFAPVAGINFLAYDSETTEKYSAFDACAKINGLDDYVEYTMGYAGYKFIRITKNGQSEDGVYKKITDSLDKDIPVLMESKNGWCILTGYDSKHFIYGYDGTFRDKHIFSEETEEFWKDMFVLSNWYDIMESVVIVTGKQEATITSEDIFKRIIRIIDDMQKKDTASALISKLENDNYITSLTKERQMELYQYLLNYLYYYACSRGELCCSQLPLIPETDMELNHIQSINGYLGNTYDCCWFAFRTLGYDMPGNYIFDEKEKGFPVFLEPEKREKIISSIKFISFNDYKISCICKIIAGEYISDLEQYLNEPKYNIPREQVGPVEMGTFTTETVTLPDTRITGRFMPISECNKDNDSDVFLVDYISDQYYNKRIFCGVYTDNDTFIINADTYFISGGEYLKITGNLPISINNIVDSWYNSNGINFAVGKKTIIEKDKNGEFVTYIPIIPN